MGATQTALSTVSSLRPVCSDEHGRSGLGKWVSWRRARSHEDSASPKKSPKGADVSESYSAWIQAAQVPCVPCLGTAKPWGMRDGGRDHDVSSTVPVTQKQTWRLSKCVENFPKTWAKGCRHPALAESVAAQELSTGGR